MSEYYRLKTEKKILGHKIEEARRNENKALVKKHRKLVLFLDIILLLAFFSNVGAYYITNVLVASTTPDIKFVEVNPAVAKEYNLEAHPQANTKFKEIMLRYLFLSMFFAYMVYGRFFLVTSWGLWTYSIIILAFSSLLLWDFTSNLSYFIGVLLR